MYSLAYSRQACADQGFGMLNECKQNRVGEELDLIMDKIQIILCNSHKVPDMMIQSSQTPRLEKGDEWVLP